MKYDALTVGLSSTMPTELKGLIPQCQYELHFVESFTVRETDFLLNQRLFHLLIADLDYLRNIRQSDWLRGIRRNSFVPVVILSDTPEENVNGMVMLRADMCISGKWPLSMIADLTCTQLQRPRRSGSIGITNRGYLYRPDLP